MLAGAERLVSIIYDARQYLSASYRILYGVNTNITQALLSDHLIRGLWLCRPLEFHHITHNLDDDVNVSQISNLDYNALQDRYIAAIIRWLHGGNGIERAEHFLEMTTGSKLLPLPMHIIKVNFDIYIGENVGVSAHTCFRTLDVLINGETAAYINADIPESPYPITLFDSLWDSCMVPTGLNVL
ncbi:hypothetical protein OF83DRAFT_1171839 [Amylostereum chailletii]|nr:hypothetical protein OF83DRAFT_1171839 [Amylostereum chailletii]